MQGDLAGIILPLAVFDSLSWTLCTCFIGVF